MSVIFNSFDIIIFWLALVIAMTSLNIVNSLPINTKRVQLLNLLDREISYSQAWNWQHNVMSKQLSEQDYVMTNESFVGRALLLQHKSVYTLGTATNVGSGPFSKTLNDGKVLEYELFNVDRAGQATYHGPGQIVLYPILDLNHFNKDIHLYLRILEDIIIDTLQYFDIKGNKINGLTGVWVGDSKVAAIGVKLRRWVTLHGLSINVDPDMSYFDNIIPCGIEDKSVGCISQWCPDVRIDDVASVLLECFSRKFGVSLDVISGAEAIDMLEGLNSERLVDPA